MRLSGKVASKHSPAAPTAAGQTPAARDPGWAAPQDNSPACCDATREQSAGAVAPECAAPAGTARAAGRPSALETVALTEDERTEIARLYLVTNVDKDGGAWSRAFARFAEYPACRPELRDLILAGRSSKHSIPPSLLDQVRQLVPPRMVQHHRNPEKTRSNRELAPEGWLRMTQDPQTGEWRRYRAGECQSWDDGSQNEIVAVPWPRGGCPCSEKYGVRVGRYQLLLGVDTASRKAPGFSLVARPTDAYRAEDIVSTLRRVWSTTHLPERVVFEKGAWASKRVHEFLDHAGVAYDHAHRSRTKLVEEYWSSLWTELSGGPGEVGRFRGEFSEGAKLLRQFRAGTLDPKSVGIPTLDERMNQIEQALRRLDSSTVESEQYGKWVPAERYATDLAGHPRPTLAGLDWHSFPNIAEVTVRGGQVRCTTNSPLVGPMPFAFAWNEAWRWDGARVRVYFDAGASGRTSFAAVVLREKYNGFKVGHILTECAECISMRVDWTPQTGLTWIDFGLGRALEIRKAQNQTLVAAHRSLAGDGTRAAWSKETRTPEGAREVVEVRTGGASASAPQDSAPAPAAPQRTATPRTAPPADPPPQRGVQDPLMKLLGVEY